MAEPHRTPRTIAESLNETKPAGEPKVPWSSTPVKPSPGPAPLPDKAAPAEPAPFKNLRRS